MLIQGINKNKRVSGVQNYYGNVLENKHDLATNVCTVDSAPTGVIKSILDDVHPDVKSRFYGCGTPFPPLLEGMTVLDLGCGGGRDCFILSKLVGEQGRVIGVDITQEQIHFANSYIDYHRNKFGYQDSNVTFYQGGIEELDKLGIPDASVDIVVSNCVINLSAAKDSVISGMRKLLKPGGEIYFADIFSDRRLPKKLKEDELIVGECIGDVLYYQDFVRLAKSNGFNDVRVVESSIKSIGNKSIEERLEGANLYSMTLRLFKLDLEDLCEDYGQVAIYKGTLPDMPHQCHFDKDHTFDTGRAVPVCKNTADMLKLSHYSKHFDVIGNDEKHYGAFDCSTSVLVDNQKVNQVNKSFSGCGC